MHPTPRASLSMLLLSAALSGCPGALTITGPERVGEAGEDLSAFDGASMVVSSPQPAQIYDLAEDLALEAEILDADGEPLDLEEEPLFVGSRGEVGVPWGIHTFTVTAALPNGDRLQTSVGAVRVQSEHTGIYSGTFGLTVNAELQGTPISAACLGGLDLTIDMAGEALRGDEGQCSINLVVLGQLDVSYGVAGDVNGDDVQGDIQLDLGFFDVPVGFDGVLDGDELQAEFGGSVILFDFDGFIDARRVSPYVDL
jgi:hypothetical protein